MAQGLFQQALEQPGDATTRGCAQQCGGDASCCAKCEALLETTRHRRGLPRKPARSDPGDSGTLLPRHAARVVQILEELGRGGMGIVYLAQDGASAAASR